MTMQAPLVPEIRAATVLVVDDMEANRAVITRRLERLAYQVMSVESGAIALDAINVSMPDIVLLDYMMPQMNGIEVLRELRANRRTRDLPVIMVTARAEASATVEALEAGADDYVTKPIDFDVLRARIETQLVKRRNVANIRRSNEALDEKVAIRSITLANLESELKEEILRRQQLERTASQNSIREGTDRSGSGTELNELLCELECKFEILFADALAGRSANLAQMADVKSSLTKVRNMLNTNDG